MRALHLLVGAVTVVAFLLTGAYMRAGFPELYAGDEVVRYQFRGNHVYVLMAGLVNLAFGTQAPSPPGAARGRWLRRTGSALVLLAPAALVWAFFREPPRAAPMKPVTALGVFALALGTLACVLAAARARR